MSWSPQQELAIKAVKAWLADKSSPQVFRLFGYAGTGKRKAFHRARGSRRHSAIAQVDRALTDSPIEHELLSALAEWLALDGQEQVAVETQAPIGPYRADILISDGLRQLVVECDGRRFHSTEQAVQHDKRRDRYCAVNGIAVMRFTGAEIRRDPRGCAAEIGVWIRRRG